MMEACKKFLTLELESLSGEQELYPFHEENIFFGPMPRDFLKTNQFAACCLVLSDRKTKNPRMVGNVRNEQCTFYTRTWRRYDRDVICRILLYAASFGEQWGTPAVEGTWTFGGFKGIVDKLEQSIAGTKTIADAENRPVDVRLEDSFRPWDQEEAQNALKRLPVKAVVRVEFSGGVYVTKQVPIISDVDIQPEYQ